MKSIKSKALFFGVSLFAFTAIHAQETPKKDTTEPKKDTTVMVNLNKVNYESTAMVTTSKADTTEPKKDTTVMVNPNKVNRESTPVVTTSFAMINDNKVAAKLEAIDNKKLI